MTYLKIGMVVAAIGLVGLVSCSDNPSNAVTVPAILSQTDDPDIFATQVLNSLQPSSIMQSREFCGFIIETRDGGLATTAIYQGGEDYCDLPTTFAPIVASFHTHGGFSDDYDNEVPSVDDMAGDLEAGTDGYISTPAGRIWKIDHEARIARQLCSVRCVTFDPNDDPSAAGFVPQTFTLPELEARFE